MRVNKSLISNYELYLLDDKYKLNLLFDDISKQDAMIQLVTYAINNILHYTPEEAVTLLSDDILLMLKLKKNVDNLISGITGISGRQIGNLHFGVGSAGTIFKVHAVLVAVQFVISGFLIIDERHLYIRIYIGIVVVLTGKQVCRIHVIAERSVAALAELAGRQAGINIVVLRLFAV